MTTKKIKLEEKEIKEIKEIRSDNNKLAFDFGRVRLDIIMLKNRLSEVEKLDSDMEAKFKGNQTKEQKIYEKLKKKYGEGTLNIETGEFISIEKKDGES
tara:strand:+ start:35 stop:331 length:297 start_codon:yes stop_codon:yes gene_type:complete